MTQSTDITEPARRPVSAQRMVRRIIDRGTKTRLIIAALISGVLALMETVAIVAVLPLVGLAMGEPIDEGALGTLWRLLGEPSRQAFGLILVVAVVLLFVLKDVFTMWFQWWQSGFLMRKRVELSSSLFHRILHLPYTDFRQRSVSELLRVMRDAVGQFYGSVIGGILAIVTGGLTVLAIVIALLIATPVQAILVAIYFAIAAFGYTRLAKPRVARAGEKIVDGSMASTLAALQGLNGFKDIKLRGSQDFFVNRYREGMTLNEQGSREGNFYSSITKYLLEILFILGIGALLLYSFATGTASGAVGSLALFVAAGFRLLPNISTLIGAVNSLRLGYPSMRLVYEEIERHDRAEESARPAPGEIRALPFARELVLDDVHFRYPGSSRDVLRGIDLTIPFGSSVAFVGGSGAGKTTLVDLILGLHSPTDGRLLADGADITGREAQWRRNTAMVSQEVHVTGNSVREDIVFDAPPESADGARLQRAIRDAQFEDVVAELPAGLDSSTGDWGARLSGGQRQRLGIARALFAAPRLLVLDEATSALDNETERRITRMINELKGELTVVVVAHRLSTVKNVDRVVFLEGGKVADSGTFTELQQRNATFAHLVKLGDLSGGGDQGV